MSGTTRSGCAYDKHQTHADQLLVAVDKVQRMQRGKPLLKKEEVWALATSKQERTDPIQGMEGRTKFWDIDGIGPVCIKIMYVADETPMLAADLLWDYHVHGHRTVYDLQQRNPTAKEFTAQIMCVQTFEGSPYEITPGYTAFSCVAVMSVVDGRTLREHVTPLKEAAMEGSCLHGLMPSFLKDFERALRLADFCEKDRVSQEDLNARNLMVAPDNTLKVIDYNRFLYDATASKPINVLLWYLRTLVREYDGSKWVGVDARILLCFVKSFRSESLVYSPRESFLTRIEKLVQMYKTNASFYSEALTETEYEQVREFMEAMWAPHLPRLTKRARE